MAVDVDAAKEILVPIESKKEETKKVEIVPEVPQEVEKKQVRI